MVSRRRRQVSRWWLRPLVVMSLLVPGGLLLAACYTNPPTVIVYGDSATTQAESYINYFASVGGAARVVDNVYPGTMPCTWMSQMLADAHNPVQASAVVLDFTGFTGLGCMSGVPAYSQAYFDQYRSDTTTAVNAFVANGAHVFLAGYPIDRDDVNAADQVTNPSWDVLNQIYQQIAAADPANVTFVDAGSSVVAPNGDFEWYLPCLPFDAACNVATPGWTVVPGFDQVRAPDGGHFCPIPPPGIGNTCAVYASGAMRYGLAIGGAVYSWLTTH